MSQVVRTSLNCPQCGQPFQAIIEQIVDVGRDPQAKARFLSGRVNMITCPNCGHSLAVGTPLLYHDPEKELLLVHVPMQLNVSPDEREGIIGDLTRRLTDSIPTEQRRAYLLQPQQVLTLPGMIDLILDADGITQEMRDAQREKMRVMEMFLQVNPDEWPGLLEQQAEHLDHEFFQMLLVTAQNAAETGKGPMAEGLLGLYNFLVQNTEVGQEIVEAAEVQEHIVREVAEELQEMGDQMTRDNFMDLVLRYMGDDDRIQALVGLIRPAFDYEFFQALAARIEAAEDDERDDLEDLREWLLELTQMIDQQTQAVLQRATDTLRVIMESEDIDAAIRPRLEIIDDTFLAVLQANIRAAQSNQDQATAERLQQVLQRTLQILRDSAPPHFRLVQDLLALGDDDEAYDLIEAEAPQFGPELLDLMDAIAADLDENNQPDNADLLRAFRDYAEQHVGEESQIPLDPEH
ncbi:MAG: hypothetical protein GYB65_18965 [Chloroflexi bacterium]|nr:hypothetical protein [Chloroflexota bacterium]